MPESPSARAAAATNAHLAQFSDADMAYHESGHAVIHHLNGGTIKRLSIERADPRRGTQPAEQPRPSTDAQKRTRLEKTIDVLVAGDAAGTIFGTAEPVVTAGSRVDHEQALRAAADAGIAIEDARAMIDTAWQRVHTQLQKPASWKLVDALAKELLQRKTLDADQVTAILTR